MEGETVGGDQRRVRDEADHPEGSFSWAGKIFLASSLGQIIRVHRRAEAMDQENTHPKRLPSPNEPHLSQPSFTYHPPLPNSASGSCATTRTQSHCPADPLLPTSCSGPRRLLGGYCNERRRRETRRSALNGLYRPALCSCGRRENSLEIMRVDVDPEGSIDVL